LRSDSTGITAHEAGWRWYCAKTHDLTLYRLSACGNGYTAPHKGCGFTDVGKGLEMAQKTAEYVPVGPVAKLLHVSPKTIARWSTEGYTSKKDGKVHVIPYTYTFGGHRRYSVPVVNDLAEELEIPERL